MKEIKKVLHLDKLDYYETHLNLINCLLPIKLTPTEARVIAAFMSLQGDINQYRFGPSARKIVMEKLEISPAGLSNFIKSLTEKGFIKKQDGFITVLPILIPEPDQQMYMFKLINTGEETKEPIITKMVTVKSSELENTNRIKTIIDGTTTNHSTS